MLNLLANITINSTVPSSLRDRLQLQGEFQPGLRFQPFWGGSNFSPVPNAYKKGIIDFMKTVSAAAELQSDLNFRALSGPPGLGF